MKGDVLPWAFEGVTVEAFGDRWTFTGSTRSWHRVRDAIIHARLFVMKQGGGYVTVRNRAGDTVESRGVPGRAGSRNCR